MYSAIRTFSDLSNLILDWLSTLLSRETKPSPKSILNNGMIFCLNKTNLNLHTLQFMHSKSFWEITFLFLFSHSTSVEGKIF